ncbi:MAG: guanine deaminase [Cyanobacteria bacterium P01_D01_bin.1]
MVLPQNQPDQPLIKAIRGSFLDFVDDPFYVSEADSVRYLPDGLLVLEGGKVKAFGPYDDLQADYGEIPTTVHAKRLIMPGFIDTHIHYPQTEIIAAYGEQLLEWLDQYVFPTEAKFQDKDYAREVADTFLDQLLSNGTTTALVLATVFPQSVDAFFEAAEARDLCMIAGKVMMDRNAPEFVCDTAESAYQESKTLIQKWHNKGRLRYAITPRFAITSTDEQLQKAGELLKEFPDVYVHSHISENLKEVEWVKELYPEREGYLDAYDQAGLVRKRSVFAHGIHLTDSEFRRLSEAGSTISFCPTSNLFLGSGLFKIEQAKSTDHPVKVGLGTDVGAGTSFSILQTANEAYKVAQLRQQKLSPFKALFLATLGGARSLCLEDTLGNFEVGKDADFIVLNLRSTPLMAFRNSADIPQSLEDLSDPAFSLIMMGDDRAIESVYILGELAYQQETSLAS